MSLKFQRMVNITLFLQGQSLLASKCETRKRDFNQLSNEY